MERQGMLDTVAAAYNPARDRLITARPLKFDGKTVAAGAVLEGAELASLSAEQIERMVRVRHITIEFAPGKTSGAPHARIEQLEARIVELGPKLAAQPAAELEVTSASSPGVEPEVVPDGSLPAGAVTLPWKKARK